MNKNFKIRKWYMEQYPSDELGAEISPAVSFEDLFEALDYYWDVYEFLGVCDSVVRERVFVKLAEIMNCEYDYIYDQWLLGSEIRESA